MKKFIAGLLTLTLLTLVGSSASSLEVGKTGLEGKEVSTYLRGSFVDAKEAESKLKNAGFEIVASYKSVKKGVTIVFTNEALKSEAAKPGRAYAAVLRLFVDTKDKTISFTNPIYFGKAFMQDEYKHKVYNDAFKAINKEFLNLKASKERLKFDDLAGYHFMMSMPYYKEVSELASGTNESLLTKAKEYKKGKLLIFELKLSDTSTLLGYDLGKRTKRFVKKIGRQNATVLPYCISIENDKASALDAKYYLAINYPLLSMSEFMTISTVPGAIEKDLEKPFK
ncbi:MAG: hypothetical protein JJW00_08230 [Sulfurimonas sp.]|nr:hypothetical protein [Sulfurimonas sp.]